VKNNQRRTKTTDGRQTNERYVIQHFPPFCASVQAVISFICSSFSVSKKYMNIHTIVKIQTVTNTPTAMDWTAEETSSIPDSNKRFLLLHKLQITHLQLVPRSRKFGSIHPFPHTPSKHRGNFTLQAPDWFWRPPSLLCH
jgi:hypothetical protein